MWKEFKEFAVTGNVLDLAIAVIIGAAFGAVVTSLVNDIIMPIIGQLIGKVDFANLYLNLSGQSYPSYKAAKDAGAAVIGYGQFINAVIVFLIIALVLFLIIRAINRMKREPALVVVEPNMKDCPYCFSKIPSKASRCLYCTSDLKAVA